MAEFASDYDGWCAEMPASRRTQCIAALGVARLAWLAAAATAFYFIAVIRGTAVLPSGIAGVLGGAIAPFTAIFSLLFLRLEKFNGMMAMGVAIGSAGIVLIARPWDGGKGAIDLRRCLLAACQFHDSWPLLHLRPSIFDRSELAAACVGNMADGVGAGHFVLRDRFHRNKPSSSRLESHRGRHIRARHLWNGRGVSPLLLSA